jgi:hypothetical protein
LYPPDVNARIPPDDVAATSVPLTLLATIEAVSVVLTAPLPDPTPDPDADHALLSVTVLNPTSSVPDSLYKPPPEKASLPEIVLLDRLSRPLAT